jgi:hypothetical protein
MCHRLASILILIAFLFSASGDCSFAAENGLIAHWRFDAAAETVKDLSGHGHDAALSGGRVIVDNGKKVLALDGGQKITVPSSPEINLSPNFTLDMKIKFDDASPSKTLLFKKEQYVLRINPAHEEGQIAFFPFVKEPRVCASEKPGTGWHHILATWDGHKAILWIDGDSYIQDRTDKPSNDSVKDSPLFIASTSDHGAGVRGAIEYVKIYNRVLTPKEILAETYELTQLKAPQPTGAKFDFAQASTAASWTAQGNAQVTADENQLLVKSQSPNTMAINKRLNTDLRVCDWASVRMSVDQGSQARLFYVTSLGVGHIPFEIVADGKPHTYILEAWTQSGWGGDLLALGVRPSNAENSTARIEQIQLTQEPVGADVRIPRIFSDSTMPRAEQPERVVVRLANKAGVARKTNVELTVPDGVTLKGPASQTIETLGHGETTEAVWEVEAKQPVTGTFRATISGKDLLEPVSADQAITFHANPHAAKADYVPVPVPAKTKYKLWTHYCALWKAGTHWGWQKIEPWPERKPVIGWYNDGSPEVADWHIKYMVEHGISGVMYCWYRTNINAPVQQGLGHAIHDGLLKARYLSMIQFGIMWENGCGAGVGSTEDLMQNVLPFWIDNYFSNPQYARVDGKPVLYVWVPSNLRKQLGGSENVRKAFDQMREECKRRGLGGLYIVASVQQPNKEALEAVAAEGWDATSAYCNNWTAPKTITQVGSYISAPYEGFVDQQESLLRFKRELHLLPDISTMMMGWDARPWHEKGFFWSENTPEKFRDLCQRTKKLIDELPDNDPVKSRGIFCCWNEFGEGHYIEPTRGKGFSYLDTIRDVFCEEPKEHVDLAPQDIGLPQPDSWYAAIRESTAARRKSLHATEWSGDQLGAWKALMGLDKVEVKDGVLRAASTTTDPAVVSPPLELRARDFTKVVVEMRVDRSTSAAQLFWGTVTTPRMGEATSSAANVIADGQWHRYVFEVAKNPTWSGCVTSLRFDPTQDKGVAVEIKSIRVE